MHMKSLNWFTKRIKKTVKRTRNDEATGHVSVSWQIVENEKVAEYLHSLQSKNIVFADNEATEDPFESDEPVVRIHKLDMDTGCESCSA